MIYQCPYSFLIFFFTVLFAFNFQIIFCQSIAAGYDFSVVLCDDNKPRSAGANGAIQLGFPNPPTTFIYTPVTMPAAGSLSSVTSLDVGYWHCLAVKSDGTAWAFGYNNYGQMGDGTVLNRDVAVQVRNPPASGFLSGIIKVSGGGFAVGGNSLALKSDGSVYAWGYGGNGEMGNNTTVATNSICFQVKDPPGTGFLSGIVDISAGYTHMLAAKSDGTAWAWGSDASGQIGNDALVSAPLLLPVQVSGLTNVIKVAAGDRFSVFLKSNGDVWSCGLNTNKRLGDNTTTQRTTPVQVQIFGGGNLTNIVAISAGEAHCLALRNDNTVWAWGRNGAYQLGDGVGNIDQGQAVQVPGLVGIITQISAGANHSIVLRSTGTNQDWGDNSWGQLGNGNTVFLGTAKSSFGAGGGSCPIFIMPVGLLSFSGKNKHGNIILEWQTASEINNDYFSIEQSADGSVWESIGTVNGFGNSSIIHDYEFIDESPIVNSESQIYYRLKQTDYDGQSEYFGPIGIRIVNKDELSLVLQNTPAVSQLFCTLYAPEKSTLKAEICDLHGKAIISKSIQAIKGSNLLQFDIDKFSDGVYFVKVSDSKGRHFEKKFVKSSK